MESRLNRRIHAFNPISHNSKSHIRGRHCLKFHWTFAVLLGLGEGEVLGQSSAPSGGRSYDEASQVYRSPALLGRGNTGIAIADEEEAIFYNPAGLALGKGIYKRTVLVSPTVQMSQNTRDIARRLGAENADAIDTVQDAMGRPNHFGLGNFSGIMLRRAAFGVVTQGSVDLLAFKDPELGGLEVVRAQGSQTTGATFTLAESFGKGHFFAGITGKYLMRGKGEIEASSIEIDKVKEKLQDQGDFLGYGSGTGADVGLMFQSGGRVNKALGVTIHDVGDTSILPQEQTALDLDLKQTINIGFAIEPSTLTSKLKLLADYRDVAGKAIRNPYKRVHLGAELTVFDMIGATGGLHHGYGSGGFFIDIYLVRLDLGFYTEEVGSRMGTRPDTRYFFGLEVGF